MAAIALINLGWSATCRDCGVLLAGEGLGDHVEMFHMVAGRGFMALRAVDGVRGWMLELRNQPIYCAVAVRAFGTGAKRTRADALALALEYLPSRESPEANKAGRMQHQILRSNQKLSQRQLETPGQGRKLPDYISNSAHSGRCAQKFAVIYGVELHHGF